MAHLGGHVGHVGTVDEITRLRLASSQVCHVMQALEHAVCLRLYEALTTDRPSVEHGDDGDGLEALVHLRCAERVAAATADAKHGQAGGVNARERGQDVCREAVVLYAQVRDVTVARLYPTLARGHGIERDGHEALLRKALRVQARSLLLHRTVGMAHHDARVRAVLAVASRGVDVGGNGNAASVVGDGVHVDCTIDVSCQRVAVHEAKGIVIIGLRSSGLIRHELLLVLSAYSRPS